MPQQAPSKSNPVQDYVTVAERIEKFYERFPDGRICTSILHHDLERGFILFRAEVYRNAEDTLPAATGHAYEFKSEGYVQRTSYIEVGETSAVGRALAMAGFEVRRGIASREEMEKSARMTRESEISSERPKAPPAPTPPPQQSKADQSATDDQKQEILGLLESLQPGDRRAQRRVLVEMTGKDSRDELTHQEASKLIESLRREVSEGSI